jgi:mono/diheme cytochrome c family protein
MKRILKWTAITVVSIVAVLLILIYGVSEYRLRQKFDIALAPIDVPTDPAGLDRGRHVFRTRGCEGCHAAGLKGSVFFDQPMLARLVAPNVVRAIKGYSDAELARLLRHGVRPNGRGVAVMPSSVFYHLDDADLGALIAYLRTLPDKGGSDTLPATSLRLLARVGVVTGKYNLEPVEITHDAPRAPNGPDAVARGRYLAKSTCTECHGQALDGTEETPDLSVVAGYSPSEFARLMREGVPRDGRKLKMMGDVARARFVDFSDEEIGALYAYLSTRMTVARGMGDGG